MADEEKKDQKVEAPTIAPKADIGVPTESVGKVKEEVKERIKEEKTKPVEEKKDKPAPSGKFKEVIEKIESLSVLELAELVKELEERFGVSAAVVAVPTSGTVGAPTESVGEEEKSSYDLVLASSGDKKIQVIKVVREIKPELGLKEAKDLVDGAPKELAKGMKKEEAEEAKKKLEAAGATVELK